MIRNYFREITRSKRAKRAFAQAKV